MQYIGFQEKIFPDNLPMYLFSRLLTNKNGSGELQKSTEVGNATQMGSAILIWADASDWPLVWKETWGMGTVFCGGDELRGAMVRVFPGQCKGISPNRQGAFPSLFLLLLFYIYGCPEEQIIKGSLWKQEPGLISQLEDLCRKSGQVTWGFGCCLEGPRPRAEWEQKHQILVWPQPSIGPGHRSSSLFLLSHCWDNVIQLYDFKYHLPADNSQISVPSLERSLSSWHL